MSRWGGALENSASRAGYVPLDDEPDGQASAASSNRNPRKRVSYEYRERTPGENVGPVYKMVARFAYHPPDHRCPTAPRVNP